MYFTEVHSSLEKLGAKGIVIDAAIGLCLNLPSPTVYVTFSKSISAYLSKRRIGWANYRQNITIWNPFIFHYPSNVPVAQLQKLWLLFRWCSHFKERSDNKGVTTRAWGVSLVVISNDNISDHWQYLAVGRSNFLLTRLVQAEIFI